MSKYLFLSGTLLIISSMTAARVPKWEPLSNSHRIDPDEISLYNNAPDGNEQFERTMNSADTKRLEKRKYGGYSYPSSSRGLPVASKMISRIVEGKVKVCDTKLEIPDHASISCKNFTGCRVECEDGYAFEDGNEYLMFVCTNKEWKANGMDYTSVPECVLEEDESEEDPCQPYEATEHSRLNCPSDTYCELSCAEGYKLPDDKKSLELYCSIGVWSANTEDGEIPLCEPEKPVCTPYVATEHSRVNCRNDKSCELRCHKGYKLPDDKKSLELSCIDGVWSANTEDGKVPLCEPEVPECKLYVPTENSRLNCPNFTFCELRCHKGYKLPGNKKYENLTCSDGVWSANTEDGQIPLCEPEEPVCEGEPPAPPRTIVTCQSDRICEASCEEGYKFPSGASSVAMSCTAHGWTVQAEVEDETTGCVREILTCNGQEPKKLENATIECDDTSCVANCVDGHKFPNGNPSINIVCGKSKWEVQGIGWESIPDCVQELKTKTKCNGSQYLVFPNLGAYKVNTSHVTWSEAQKTCIHEGAHLAIIDSKEELELMKDLIAPHHMKNGWTYAHVGFSDLAKRGVWVTVLGTILDSVHYTKWAPRNPSKLNERCGAIDHKGRLHDIFCTSEQIFICEKM